MAVIERTTGTGRHGARSAPVLLGGTLIAVLLLLLAAPCDRGRCAVPAASVQAPSAMPHPDASSLPLPATATHCAMHCGLLLLPTFVIVVMPALAMRVTSGAPAPALRTGAPPLLPPPQTA